MKSNEARQLTQHYYSTHMNQRHSEIKWNNIIYNCAIGCNVINMTREDCNLGIVLVVAVKASICLRDILFRIRERNESARDDPRRGELALYDPKFESPVPVDGFLSLEEELSELDQIHNKALFTSLLTPIKFELPTYTIKNSQMPHGPRAGQRTLRGVWVKTTIKRKQSLPTKETSPIGHETLLLGYNTVRRLPRRPQEYVQIIAQGNLEQWRRPFERALSCLVQLDRAIVLCNPHQDEIDELERVVRRIASNDRLPMIDWFKFPDRFLGGLPSKHINDVELCKELRSIKTIHYISGDIDPDDPVQLKPAERERLQHVRTFVNDLIQVYCTQN